MRQSIHSWSRRKRWLLGLFVTLIVIGSLRHVIIKMYVTTEGMSPTIENGDVLLASRAAYLWHAPKHGDIVVFTGGGSFPPGHHVMRVIGVSGDVIEMKNGCVYRNGAMLREPYLGDSHEPYLSTGPMMHFDSRPMKLHKGNFYVLGDNRANCADSRVLGPIRTNMIIGKVIAIHRSHHRQI